MGLVSEEVQRYIMDILRVRSRIPENMSLTRLVDGKSGAQVFRMDIVSDRSRLSGIYILKLLDIHNTWYEHSNNEATKGKELYNRACDFVHRLVTIEANAIVGDYHVIIYSYANDSALNTVALSKLKLSEASEFLTLISYELLQNLNAGVLTVDSSDAFSVLQSLLTYRLGPEGTFSGRIENMLLDKNLTAINIKGSVFPNPYHYLYHCLNWQTKISPLFLKGNIHGDLHADNVLTAKANPGVSQKYYSVIDYDTCDFNNYLLFDHAYLELSLYLKYSSDNDLHEWEETVRQLPELSLVNTLDSEERLPCVAVRESICTGIRQWLAHDENKKMQDPVIVQFLLARIAAGINYFSKRAIEDPGTLQKLLIYIGIAFERLFDCIGYEYDRENSTRLVQSLSKDDYTDELWNVCNKFMDSSTKVLLTDDTYKEQQYRGMHRLSDIDWSLVIDIGAHVSPNDLFYHLSAQLSEHRKITLLSSVNDVNTGDFNKLEHTPNTCTWINVKNTECLPSGKLWKQYQSLLKKVIKMISESVPLRPFLFVLDCQINISFAERLLQYIIESEGIITHGSRFVSLGNKFSQDDIDSLEGLYHYYAIPAASLEDIDATVEKYIPPLELHREQLVRFPARTHLDGTILPKEQAFYETSVELVYPGIEMQSTELDYGHSFYRGEEIKWIELAYNVDISLLSNYDEKREELIKILEESKLRVLSLSHGAGSGGTTLSKRLLWDVKEQYPCVRIKKYTKDTINILCEIYRKTGRCVLVVLEIGSTIISEDEFLWLNAGVNAENCRAVFLRVERLNSVKYEEESQADELGKKDQQRRLQSPFIVLGDVLPDKIAHMFRDRYSLMTDDPERKKCIYNITTYKTSTEWGDQCCPFFYGFYTFLDEYHGMDAFINRTVETLPENIKNILSDLAIITIYSQNLFVSYHEMAYRLEIQVAEQYSSHGKLGDAFYKLTIRKNDGWRFCHPTMAKRWLERAYKISAGAYKERVYEATIGLITRLKRIYSATENGYVDDYIKELLIDRTYVDGEKTKFSLLINDIPLRTKQELIFKELISLYPHNPHYYNHLGRLCIAKNPYAFNDAIGLLEKAIDISDEADQDPVSHYTTLACIYSKKVTQYLKDLIGNRFKTPIQNTLQEIQLDYSKANDLFDMARNRNQYNSYGYFPNILMICNLIHLFVENDHERNLDQLIDQEDKFRIWYNENVGKAARLLSEMDIYCTSLTDQGFQQQAQMRLDTIRADVETLYRQLNRIPNDLSLNTAYARRTYVYALYAQYKHNWDNMKKHELALVEQNMRVNFQVFDLDTNTGDVVSWFETFRRLPDFSATDAIKIIEDYMPTGYHKSYLLYLMEFIRYEKGLGNQQILRRYISDCVTQTKAVAGLNTTRYLDVYGTFIQGCPIIRSECAERNKDGDFINLKTFYGIISSIDGATKGSILIDNLNIDAFFTPYRDNSDRAGLTFKHVDKRVSFNLMFSYSGLRAWNVTLTE